MLLLLPIILNSVGVLAQDPVFRIVGGEPVSIRDRPFQVLIYRIISRGVTPDCGGAILNRRWIVTAAHCVYGTLPDNMIVRAGSDDLNKAAGTAWYKIKKLIAHERYAHNGPVTAYDVALLMTTRKIVFSRNIKSIGLVTTPPKPGVEAIVSGFGVTAEGNKEMSSILRQVSVTVVDREDCLDLLGKTAPGAILSRTHFCAAELAGGKDACQGDSGGPLTIDDFLAGVVSWGIGCARAMVPAFYTDLSQFVPWIETTIHKYSKPPRCTCPPSLSNETDV